MDAKEAIVTVLYPKRVVKERAASYMYLLNGEYYHSKQAGKDTLTLTAECLKRIADTLTELGAKDSDRIIVRVKYPATMR